MDLVPTRGCYTPHEIRAFRRFEELRSAYPTFSSYFESNKSDLLLALEDIWSDTELLEDTQEINSLGISAPCQYMSSSIFAAEDNLISILDNKDVLQSFCSIEK